jgi:WD40 repeat protein
MWWRGNVDRTVRLWELAAGTARVLEGHTGWVSALAVLPDGRLASAGNDGTVRIWDLAAGNARVLEGHTGWIGALAELPEGRLASAGIDRTVRVWELAYEAVRVFVADAPVICLGVDKASNNRASYFNPNWKQDFWGKNYSRLEAIKAKYDPDGLFFVHHGVGSEQWSSDGFARLV